MQHVWRQAWGFAMDIPHAVNPRVVEYHEMRQGGSLSSMSHCDIGSLVTVDLMLQEPSAIEPMWTAFGKQRGGGQFQTINNHAEIETVEAFHPGDALAFVSHKLHRVSPITGGGARKVLVVEYWHGAHRLCGHRCEARLPQHCSLSLC